MDLYGPADEYLNAAAILDIVKAKGFKSVVVISHNEPNALSVATEFVTEATAAGLQAVLLADTIDIGTVDITPQANKLKALADKQGADCIVSVVWPTYRNPRQDHDGCRPHPADGVIQP